MKSDERIISFDKIINLVHENAETSFSHTTYQEESRRFHYLLNGDDRAIEESVKLCDPLIQGKLSEDPLRNFRYLFIINTGLATRYIIEAGVPQETAYSISDLYIQKADIAGSIEEISYLNKEVWTVFVETVRSFKKESPYSKPILFCLNYIDSHFNEKIILEDIAEKTGLHPCYLATLFKKETGKTFGNYLTEKRIETSKALLSKTDYSFTQIACSLAFCSQSHFTKVFRQHTGFTPKQYRTKFFNTHLTAVGK
ncbi:MAG: AraC family transcriptional regulator [Lachnospiraceae bacterium]|nr:AraC family transcriptional regulator [Lachnospiraceae bacterium]